MSGFSFLLSLQKKGKIEKFGQVASFLIVHSYLMSDLFSLLSQKEEKCCYKVWPLKYSVEFLF